MTARLGVDAALVDGELVAGDVAIDSGRVAEVGLPADGSGYLAAAGFVDVQVNGFAGVDFASSDVAGYKQAGARLAATGVTSFQPTFITLPWDSYQSAIATAQEAHRTTEGMVGVHLEGPFIAPERCGAHDPNNVVTPTAERIATLIAHDIVTWVTVAPEIPGGLDAVIQFAAGGKRVAIGHSDASSDVAAAAFEAGATAVTHLFNAQSPMTHRAPGIPGAAFDDNSVAVTMIVDGHHLAPEVIRLVFALAAERTVLITDAIAGAGIGDGEVRLGDRTVVVTLGKAALPDGTLAGSVLTMDEAVRNAVDAGIPMQYALVAATANPARLVGGSVPTDLSPGRRADAVVLDSDLTVVRTLRNGSAIHHR